MASEGASSSARGVPLPSSIKCIEAGDEKDDIALTCKCGVFAILYKSRTPTNPNRLFFGCPFYKLKIFGHCKFFVWLDDHIAAIVGKDKSKSKNKVDDVKEYFEKKKVEQRAADLEKNLLQLESKKNVPKLWIVVAVFIGVVTTIMLRNVSKVD